MAADRHLKILDLGRSRHANRLIVRDIIHGSLTLQAHEERRKLGTTLTSMMLVHWGNTDSKHNHSTTAYWGDNWDRISAERRGNHPCFDPRKDLVIPAWKVPDPFSLQANYSSRPREKRKRLFYFNGNLGPAYEKGRPEDSYSMGIRQKLAEEFGLSPDKEDKLGKQHADDVIVTPSRSDNYHKAIASSIFCGVFPGDGWSGRMEDSILQGCVPVIIQNREGERTKTRQSRRILVHLGEPKTDSQEHSLSSLDHTTRLQQSSLPLITHRSVSQE